MQFLSLILWLGGLCTDANDDNYARPTIHDYTGSFGIIPNAPKSGGMFFDSTTPAFKLNEAMCNM